MQLEEAAGVEGGVAQDGDSLRGYRFAEPRVKFVLKARPPLAMILLDKVTKRFGPKILFENVSMQFDPGKRYGVTGANGAGKSTLLEMLAEQDDWDAGRIDISGGLRLGVLEQNHFVYDEQRILDTVMAGKAELWAAMSEKERLLAGEVDDDIGVRLASSRGSSPSRTGTSAESEAAELLVGLGIPAERHGEPMRTLPAGYKLRVLIAKVLFGRPDVMLLDEPTNHLDLESIHWLMRFLVDDFKGTLLVVSHDRHFLNRWRPTSPTSTTGPSPSTPATTPTSSAPSTRTSSAPRRWPRARRRRSASCRSSCSASARTPPRASRRRGA